MTINDKYKKYCASDKITGVKREEGLLHFWTS